MANVVITPIVSGAALDVTPVNSNFTNLASAVDGVSNSLAGLSSSISSATTGDIAGSRLIDDTVTGAKIAADTITSQELADNQDFETVESRSWIHTPEIQGVTKMAGTMKFGIVDVTTSTSWATVNVTFGAAFTVPSGGSVKVLLTPYYNENDTTEVTVTTPPPSSTGFSFRHKSGVAAKSMKVHYMATILGDEIPTTVTLSATEGADI